MGPVVERAVMLVTVAVHCAEEAAASAAETLFEKTIQMVTNPTKLNVMKPTDYRCNDQNKNVVLGRHLGNIA
jgi:hypothetical protein